jgi:hypothetical protein
MVGFLQTRFVTLLFTICGYLPIQTSFLSAALSFLLHVLYHRSDNLYEVFDLVGAVSNGMVGLVATPATFAATKCHPVGAESRGQDDFVCSDCLRGLCTELCNCRTFEIGLEVGEEGLDLVGSMPVPSVAAVLSPNLWSGVRVWAE